MLSLDYILIQPDQGNTYELQGSRKVRLGPYLGQEVEVTGVESPSMSTSSDFLMRTGSPSPVTISVHSIKSLAKRWISAVVNPPARSPNSRATASITEVFPTPGLPVRRKFLKLRRE
jgi:hypothetical protein